MPKALQLASLLILQLFILYAGLIQLLICIQAWRHAPFFGVDFKEGYLVTAHMHAEGLYAQLYDKQACSDWQIAHGFRNLFSPILYPPLMGGMLAPYAGVPVPDAVDQWFWSNLRLALGVGAGLGLWLAWSRPNWQRLLAGLAGALCFSLSAPVLDCLIYGQTGIFLTAISLGYCWFYGRGLRVWAAACLSLAISLKVYPAALLLPALARRDWRLLGFTALGCLLWSASVGLYIGSAWWGLISTFLKLVPNLAGVGGNPTDASLSGACMRWLGPQFGKTIGSLLSLALIGLTLLIDGKSRGRRQLYLGLALAIYVQCLCVGRCWPHYHMVLWLALVLSALSQDRKLSGFLMAQWLLMMPIALLDCDVASWGMELRLASAEAGLFCLLPLLQWGLCLMELRRQQALDRLPR